MGGYDPAIHHRRSIRLPAYDYAQPGPYFITVNTQHRTCTLGVVEGDSVTLSAVGKIVTEEIDRLPERFAGVVIDASVIMPNHIHAIISIVETQLPSLAAQDQDAVAADDVASASTSLGAIHRARTSDIYGAPVDAPRKPTLGEIVRSFKASAARSIRRDCDAGFAWHRNYYERVIRDERELRAFHEYILTNPARWATDDLFMAGGRQGTRGNE